MTDLIGLQPSKGVSSPSGFVQCCAHNVRRKAECCEMRPVFNADMEVIDYICVCKQAFMCKCASDRPGNTSTGGAVAMGAHTDSQSGVSSVAAPVVIDASSTSLSAHASPSHYGRLAASGTADGDAGVGALFAVSFYRSSSTVPGLSESAAAGVVSANASPPPPQDGEKKGGGREGASKAETTTISDSESDEVNSLENLPSFNTGAAPAIAATAVSAASPLSVPRGRPRYYDSIQNTGAGGNAPPVKVCWSCGMPGHEKPACSNLLCRTCHQKRGPYGSPHRCALVVTPSPFIVCPTPSEWHTITQKSGISAGEPSGMEAVRCVACNEYGHFDCSTIAPPSSYALVASASTGPAAVPHTVLFTCCFCGVRGHTIFDCRQREQVNPDNFERRNQLVADAIRRRGCNPAAGAPLSNSGSYSGYDNPQQHQRPPRSYGGPTGGAQPSASSFTRHGNDGAGSVSGVGQRRERDWRDDRGQRSSGGNQSNNPRREGGYCDTQRRRYESPSFSGASGVSASPSSPYLHGRERYKGDIGGYHEDRHQNNYGSRRHTHGERSRGGGSGGSRGHDETPRFQQSQHQHGSSRRGGRRRRSGYDSGDDLF